MKVLWTPNPGPQTAFLACDCDWVLYGGRLGGGKTDALLADYLGQVHKPGYSGLFLRRSYPELLQVIRRSLAIYPALGGKYSRSQKIWTFPSGATLRFGYVTSYDDALRYASDEYAWLAIDECTHVPYDAFQLLTTRVRAAAHLGLSTFIRLSANPNGKHMLWVRALFIHGKKPMVVYTDPKSGVRSTFIPAGLAPQLLGTGYDSRLQGLGENERKALLAGDWYAYEGAVFTLVADVHVWTWERFNAYHGLPAWNRGIPADWNRYRVMDWGFARPFAIYWIAVDYDERAWVYREWYGVATNDQGEVQADVGLRLEPETVAQGIADAEAAAPVAAQDGEEPARGEFMTTAWTGPDLFNHGRGDYGASRKLSEYFEDHGVYSEPWDASTGSRLAGKMALHQRLFYEKDEGGEPLTMPGMIFLDEETPHAQRTLPALTYDPHQPELVDKKGEDHGFDALAGFCKMRPYAPRVAVAATRHADPDDWRARI